MGEAFLSFLTVRRESASFVRGRAKLISVTIVTHRESRKAGLNRKPGKSAPKRANDPGNEKLYRLSNLIRRIIRMSAPDARGSMRIGKFMTNLLKPKENASAASGPQRR
jgi:hypothetical protein